MHKCFYCSNLTNIKCTQCDKHYCNNRGSSSISHIIFHLIRSKHISITHDRPLKCSLCGSKNVFNLGYLPATFEEESETEAVEEFNLETNEMEIFLRPKEKFNIDLQESLLCRKCGGKEWISLINERCLSDTLVKSRTITESRLNKMDMVRIEEPKIRLPRTKLRYTLEDYKYTYTTLMTRECEQEKKVKEELRQENVKVTFESRKDKRKTNLDASEYVVDINFYCYFHIDESENRISTGDEIIIYNDNVKIKSFIVQNNHSDAIKSRIYRVEGELKENDLYTIKYVWKSVGRERMAKAISKIELLDTTLLDFILGSAFESEGKKRNFGVEGFLGNTKVISAIDILIPPGLPLLNESQERAVKAALFNSLTLIQGPPGTGKTVTTAAIVYNLVQKRKGKILVVANSNTAIDHITEKIYRTGLNVVRIVSRRRENMSDQLSFLSLHEQTNKLLGNVERKKTNHTNNTISDINNALKKNDRQKVKAKHKYNRLVIENADVITCTCVTAGQRILSGFDFPYVLIDEAVQCTEPLSLIPLMYNSEKLILIGDHKQLGPIILDKAVEKAGYKLSLFERMIKLGYVPFLLNVQYRMHPMLSEWPSNNFYNGSLRNGVHNNARPNKTKLPFPTFFYVCYGKEEISSSGTSFLNQIEGSYCESIVKELILSGVKEKQIGIITPYEGQKAFLVNKLKDYNTEDLEISNVDAFQGREKDFIIVSLVRSNYYQGIGFVSDKKRLNVTLTRARYCCVIIGNPSTLMKNSMWNNLISHYQENNRVYEGFIGNLKRCNVVEKKVVDLAKLFESFVL